MTWNNPYLISGLKLHDFEIICPARGCICTPCIPLYTPVPYHHKLSQSTRKPTKWHMPLAKTQISLLIHAVWSEAWTNLGPLATHTVHSKDWSNWVDTQADLSLCWVHRSFCWFCCGVAQIYSLPFPSSFLYKPYTQRGLTNLLLLKNSRSRSFQPISNHL